MARVDEREELKAIAHAIRNVRTACGETQTAFARRFGVSRDSVACWEGAAKLPVTGTLMDIQKLAQRHKLKIEEGAIQAALVRSDDDIFGLHVQDLIRFLDGALYGFTRLPMNEIATQLPGVDDQIVGIGDMVAKALELANVLDPASRYRPMAVMAAREKRAKEESA